MAAEALDEVSVAVDAARRRAWPEAVANWCAILGSRPGDRLANMGLSEALAALGAGRAAAAVIEDALTQHPDDPHLLRSMGQTAERGRDFSRAVRAWRRLAEVSPDEAYPLAALCRNIRDGGDPDTAAAMLADARRRFPDSADIMVQSAVTAFARQDWAEARDRWTDVLRLMPTHPAAAERVAQCDAHLTAGLAAGLAAGPTVPPLSRQKIEPGSLRRPTTPERTAIFNDVVNLGENCEVGLLQREYAAEPLGLLRWARTPTRNFAGALEERFAGFGDPAYTELFTLDGRWFELNTRYAIRSHTAVLVPGSDRAVVLQRQCRKQRKLAELLVHQMATSSKLFVLQAERLSDGDIERVARGLRAIGPATALFIRVTEADAPVGRIDEVADGILVGSIDRLSSSETGVVEVMSPAVMLRLIEAGYARMLERRAT